MKPNIFYGFNYIRWREQMTLWLTAMAIMEVAKGKLEQSTSEEESSFDAKDVLFRGYVLGVIYVHLMDP